MTKPGRIACEGIGCRRTASAEKYGPETKIICGKCWRLAPKALRLERRAAEREVERQEARVTYPESHPHGLFVDRAHWNAWFAAHEKEKALWAAIIEAVQQARTGI